MLKVPLILLQFTVSLEDFH